MKKQTTFVLVLLVILAVLGTTFATNPNPVRVDELHGSCVYVVQSWHDVALCLSGEHSAPVYDFRYIIPADDTESNTPVVTTNPPTNDKPEVTPPAEQDKPMLDPIPAPKKDNKQDDSCKNKNDGKDGNPNDCNAGKGNDK